MKLVFVCFEFESGNLRKQPWRYVSELTVKYDDEIDVVVITDVDSDVGAVPVRTVPQLSTVTGPSRALLRTIEAEEPDVVATVLGPSSFVRPRTVGSELTVPTVGVMTSPLYGVRDLWQVGLREYYRHHEYLTGHTIGALTPSLMIRRHLDQFDRVVTMTRSTAKTLGSSGTGTRIDVVEPGIDPFDLELPPADDVERVRRELSPDGVPVVLYFTSPLTLRGTDTLIEAFARVRESIESRLVILARQDGGGLTAEEQYLTTLAARRGIEDSFELLPRDLTPTGVKTYLRASDVVALPYKIVISGVPVSILEAMAMGKSVVTTATDGLVNHVSDEPKLVEPNDVSSLRMTLEGLVTDDVVRETAGNRNREWMRSHCDWNETRSTFVRVLEDVNVRR